MQINLTGRNIETTAAIEEYAEKKVKRLERYFDRIQSIAVILDRRGHEFHTEIIVDVEHHDPFVAQGSHEDLYACIDLTADRSSRQLTDHKSKLRDNKHTTPIGGMPA